MRRRSFDLCPFGLAVALALLAAALPPSPASGQSACLPAPDGLIAWWPGDGDGREIQAGRDGSPAGGVSFAAGMVDDAFELDGVDGRVEVPEDAALRAIGELTIDLWARFDSVPRTGVHADSLALLEKGDFPFSGFFPSGTGGDFVLRWRADEIDNLELSIADACEGAYHVSAYTVLPDLQPGSYHHIAVTAKDHGAAAPTEFRYYVDGVERPAINRPSAHETCGWHTGESGDLRIGARTIYDPLFFDGAIDEVELFDRVLTQSEIVAIYEAGSDGKCKDEDGDGFRPPDDCDESDPAVNPAAVELPGNFVDENCDGDLGTCDPCFPWRNHGEYVRCVAHAVEDLVNDGVLSEDEGDVLVSSAAMSQIGKKGYVPTECQ